MLKVGDKVKINSKEWFDREKNDYEVVHLEPLDFLYGHSGYCGKSAKITRIERHVDDNGNLLGTYKLDIDNGDYWWGDGMFSKEEALNVREYVLENFDIIKFGGFYVIFDLSTKTAITEFFENKDSAIDYVTNYYNYYHEIR